MRKVLFTAVLSVILLCVKAQVQEVWTATYSYNAGSLDVSTLSTLDQNGNLYIAGKTQNGNDERYMTIIKYNSDGVEQWKRILANSVELGGINPVAIAIHGNDIFVTATTNSFGT